MINCKFINIVNTFKSQEYPVISSSFMSQFIGSNLIFENIYSGFEESYG